MTIVCGYTSKGCINEEGTCKECVVRRRHLRGELPPLVMSKIGIPLDEVGDRLVALDKCLKDNGMALKADTGVNIDCSRDKRAIGFVLEVVIFEKLKEEEDGQRKES